MKFFLDTANFEEIKEAYGWGVIAGVTTNPSLVSKEGNIDFYSRVKEIADYVQGPTSAEATSMEKDVLLKQALEIAALSPNIVVKIPCYPDGLGVVKELSKKGIKTNVTLIFSANQAVLAAAAGATYVSPFVGRLDDISEDGIRLIEDVKEAFIMGGNDTKIIAASLRHPAHVLACAKAGADFGTVPFKVLKQLFNHPLPAKGIDQFNADWAKFLAAK